MIGRYGKDGMIAYREMWRDGTGERQVDGYCGLWPAATSLRDLPDGTAQFSCFRPSHWSSGTRAAAFSIRAGACSRLPRRVRLLRGEAVALGIASTALSSCHRTSVQSLRVFVATGALVDRASKTSLNMVLQNLHMCVI